MEYDQSDSSGTDDDLPPSRAASRGVRVSGNGRATTGAIYVSSQSSNVDQMIHRLEQEAYTAVLRAFGAQSGVITWAKERLMTDLRKELRVSDEQHREFLGKVASDDTLQQIQHLSAVQPTAAAPSTAEVALHPASSQSRKKQKTAHVPQVTLPPPPPPAAAPAPSVKSASAPATGPTPKRGAPPGQRGKKRGRGGATPKGTPGHKNPVGRPAANKTVTASSDLPIDPYVGRRVKVRWPEDGSFYEAVITDFNAEQGVHVLVYDMDTEHESWETVNLKETPPGDLKWVEGPNAVLVGRKAPPPGSKAGMGRGMKRGGNLKGGLSSPGGRPRGGGRGRGWRNPASVVENGSRSVELVPLEDLAKEVDKLGEEGKFESAKRAAKAHEEAIRKVLAEVGESSDEGESDDAGHAPSSHTQSLDQEREQRSKQNSRDPTVDSDEDETAGEERGGDGSDGEHAVGEAGGASDADDDQQGEDGDDKDEG